MIKIIILAVLCISVFQVQAQCGSLYYGVEQDQPFAVGYEFLDYDDDIGEYYGSLSYDSKIHQHDNGTYVAKGTYKISLGFRVYNKYLHCRWEYNKNPTTSEVYHYERHGFRSPSQIGQNFTKEEVLPNYNITLKFLLQRAVLTYIQENPVVDPYVLDILESFPNTVQTNQNSQQY